MKNSNIKRILFTVSFFLLSIIDWVLGTQDGRYQFVATNLTGVAVAVIICSTYQIKEFLKPIYYVWGAKRLHATDHPHGTAADSPPPILRSSPPSRIATLHGPDTHMP